MRALAAELRHPERAYPTLLIAGTNGKGSVVAYLDAGLRAAGLRVGRYTSPHLIDLRERIVVNGRPIGERALDRAIATVREAGRRLQARRVIAGEPTYFEALTGAAFVHFREQRIDVAVLEVGLGGRLDATNVSAPRVSAIVSIDFDHEQYLGHTLASIAREKAGVLRRGRATVLGALPTPARRAIAAVARRRGARLVAARRIAPRGSKALPGAHQIGNLSVALEVLDAAWRTGLRFDLRKARRGVGRAVWPGRLQWLAGRPRVLLDGAHNPAGARALAEYLRDQPPFVLVFGAMRDKNVRAMAKTLFPLAERVVLTRAGLRRAASPEEIARRAGAIARTAIRGGNPRRALARARALAGPRGLVVVAGSLYVVGAALELLRHGAGRRARP